jgi:hypothetical protein
VTNPRLVHIPLISSSYPLFYIVRCRSITNHITARVAPGTHGPGTLIGRLRGAEPGRLDGSLPDPAPSITLAGYLSPHLRAQTSLSALGTCEP